MNFHFIKSISNINNITIIDRSIKKYKVGDDEGDSSDDGDCHNNYDGGVIAKAGWDNGDIDFGDTNDDGGDEDKPVDGNDIDDNGCSDNVGNSDDNHVDDRDKHDGESNEVRGGDNDDDFDYLRAGDGESKVDLGDMDSGGSDTNDGSGDGVDDAGGADTNGSDDASCSDGNSKAQFRNDIIGGVDFFSII